VEGFDGYSNVLAGNTNANQSGTAARTAGAARLASVATLAAPLAMKFCAGMCKDVKHIMIEGNGHRSDETMGTCMLISSSTAARQQGQQGQN
jgi:hypothetical protein